MLYLKQGEEQAEKEARRRNGSETMQKWKDERKKQIEQRKC